MGIIFVKATFVVLLLTSSQASAARSYKTETREIRVPLPTKPGAPIHNCEAEINLISFEPGEIILETVCGKINTFVLTNTSLIVVTPSKEEDSETGIEGVTLLVRYTRTDLREILSHGLVTWKQSDIACYFLTKNGALRILSINEKDDGPEYLFPFDVQKAKMIYHSGFLFIAAPAAQRLVIISIHDKHDPGGVPLLFPAENSEFYFLEGKLYFGEKDGKKAEIRINGKRVDDVKVVSDY